MTKLYEIMEIVKKMKIAINSYKTVEYQKLGIDLHQALTEYFLESPKILEGNIVSTFELESMTLTCECGAVCCGITEIDNHMKTHRNNK